MWKLRVCVFAVTGVCALAAGGVAGAASGGDTTTGLIFAPAGSTGVPLAVVRTSISATRKTRRKHRGHELLRPVRHLTAHKHAVGFVKRRPPTFTG